MRSRLARKRRIGRLVGPALLLGTAAAAATIATAGNGWSPATRALPESTKYYPAFAPPPPAQASGGSRSQRGETWNGTAPAGTGGRMAVHAFEVVPDLANASLTATISWDAGRALSDGLELYVDRLDRSGNWVEIGGSANTDLLDDGEATQSVMVDAPPAGVYRTRAVNVGSRTRTYHGSIGFAVAKDDAEPSPERATADRPDIKAGAQLHVLYVVPENGVDEALDTNGVIEDSVAALNAWFEHQTSGRRLRLDTYVDREGRERLDVSFVEGWRTGAAYATGAAGPFSAFMAITDELAARGWTSKPRLKRYLVYYAGAAEDSNVCGTARVPVDGEFAQWSVVFLESTPGCGARDFGTPVTGGGMAEAIAAQELQHNEGIAPAQARHQCWSMRFHICAAGKGRIPTGTDAESVDVMFPLVTAALRDKQLDPGHDDYFEHPFAYRDLADSPFWGAG